MTLVLQHEWTTNCPRVFSSKEIIPYLDASCALAPEFALHRTRTLRDVRVKPAAVYAKSFRGWGAFSHKYRLGETAGDPYLYTDWRYWNNYLLE